MTIITFLFVFCIIGCAPAFHGFEVDQVTPAGEAVKGIAEKLEASAKEIDALFVTQLEAKTKEIGVVDAAPAFHGLKVGQVTSTVEAVKRPTSELHDEARNKGTPINGLRWPSIGISRSTFMKNCEGATCSHIPDEAKHDYCINLGCDGCNTFDECDLNP